MCQSADNRLSKDIIFLNVANILVVVYARFCRVMHHHFLVDSGVAI